MIRRHPAVAAIVAVAALFASASADTVAATTEPPGDGSAAPAPTMSVEAVAEAFPPVDDASRILPVTGDLAEVVYALGFGDHVVATDVSATYPDEAQDTPKIGYQRALDAETILAYEPTLVLTDDRAGPVEVFDALEAAGVDVVTVEYHADLQAPAYKVRAVASTLGVPDEGEELVAEFERELASGVAVAADGVAQNGRPLVLALYLRGDRVQYAFGRGSGIDTVIDAAGGVDVGTALGVEDYGELSTEAIIDVAPDFILVPTNGLESVGGLEGLLAVPGIAETPAGADPDHRILQFETQFLYGLGPRTGQLVADLATAIHQTPNNMEHHPMRIRIPHTAAAIVTGAAGLVAAAPSVSASAPPADATAVDCAAIAASFEGTDPGVLSTFIEAMDAAESAEISDAEPPFTVFIPVNAAFEALPDGVLDAILADADMLATILDYHLVPGQNLVAADLADAGSVETLTGDSIEFALEGDALTLNGGAATVLCPDLAIDDAIVHIVDGILQPPSLAGGGAGGSSVPGSSTPGSSVPALDPDQQAVADAWETATDSSLTFDEQAPFIEDAESLRATIEAYPAAAEVVGGISTNVKTVAIDGETAAITYTVSFNGVEQSYGELDASLVLVDGTWVVPQAEYCAVQAYARNDCAV